MGFQPRTYRKGMHAHGLVSFSVVVEETDLHVSAERELGTETRALVKSVRAAIEKHIREFPDFATSLIPLPEPTGGEVAAVLESMYRAGVAAGTGPMAAVAGSVAEQVGSGLLNYTEEVIVENGGDVFIASRDTRVASIFAGASVLSNRVGLVIPAGRHGVCTSSGRVGPSLSMGKADAAVVVATDAALADAVATALGNRIRDAEDIEAALEWVQCIDGVMHAAIVVGENFGTWGQCEVVPISEHCEKGDSSSPNETAEKEG